MKPFNDNIVSFLSVWYHLRTVPLLDPGVLNCDESKSLRGVDMLLASKMGIGDVSLTAELQKDNIWRANGTYFNCVFSFLDCFIPFGVTGRLLEPSNTFLYDTSAGLWGCTKGALAPPAAPPKFCPCWDLSREPSASQPSNPTGSYHQPLLIVFVKYIATTQQKHLNRH